MISHFEDCSVADVVEYESLPDHVRTLCEKVFANREEEAFDLGYKEGRDKGFEVGRESAFQKIAEEQKRAEKKL